MAAKSNVRYIPAIDGLRAIAVIAVVLYHLGFAWIPGGFLGVDLFFVISGYVITRVLLESIRRSGGLDLRGFYIARARRLLPPLVFMVVTTALFVGVWAPARIKQFLIDVPFLFTGTMNWWFVYRHQDYFATIGRPSLLQHTWSLAVESQFYLVWPLILLLVLHRYGRYQISHAALAMAAVSGSLLLLLSVRLHSSDVQSVSHIYFGTDTHSVGLFLGSALAVSWVPEHLSDNISRRARNFIDGVGVFGLLGLIAAFLIVQESDATLYRFAFPSVSIFGCLVIASVAHPSSRLAPMLSSKTILWIGHRSYAIYLWHWVIIQVTQPNLDITGSLWALDPLRILLTLALADISFRWVELPTRSRAVELWFRGLKYRTKAVRVRQLTTLITSLVGILIATSLVSANAISLGERSQSSLEKSLAQDISATITPTSAPQGTATPLSTGAPAKKASGLWVIGDSVILGVGQELGKQQPIALVNARVGRQVEELVGVIEHDKAKMADATIVLDLGNNNRLTESQVAKVFEEISNQPRSIIVNTAVPRPWRDSNNALIARFAQNAPRTTVVDWGALSEGHPEYFTPDGVHLEPSGISRYVNAILLALKS